jgi:hypothetical protein
MISVEAVPSSVPATCAQAFGTLWSMVLNWSSTDV